MPLRGTPPCADKSTDGTYLHHYVTFELRATLPAVPSHCSARRVRAQSGEARSFHLPLRERERERVDIRIRDHDLRLLFDSPRGLQRPTQGPRVTAPADTLGSPAPPAPPARPASNHLKKMSPAPSRTPLRSLGLRAPPQRPRWTRASAPPPALLHSSLYRGQAFNVVRVPGPARGGRRAFSGSLFCMLSVVFCSRGCALSPRAPR